jgi:hypothetical protein
MTTFAKLFLRGNDLVFYCSDMWADLRLLLQNPYDSEHEYNHKLKSGYRNTTIEFHGPCALPYIIRVWHEWG